MIAPLPLSRPACFISSSLDASSRFNPLVGMATSQRYRVAGIVSEAYSRIRLRALPKDIMGCAQDFDRVFCVFRSPAEPSPLDLQSDDDAQHEIGGYGSADN